MDILDTLRQAPSAELYRLYLAIGKMLDDPRRILEVRQRLHLGMSVDYVGDNPLEPLSQGTIVELQHTQAVVQDSRSRRHWAIPYAAIVPGKTAPVVHPEPPPSPRAKREEFVIGDTVGFTDKHLNERFGIFRQTERENRLDRGDRLGGTLARFLWPAAAYRRSVTRVNSNTA